jgi:tripartite-type tricarboxylate transporter receptor subunit TctC
MLQQQALSRLSRVGIALLSWTPALPGCCRQAPKHSARPIRIVVPTSAGTPPDIISRIIASELSDAEGWKVVVENEPGAVQTVGGLDVLHQPTDGYSIFAMSLPCCT